MYSSLSVNSNRERSFVKRPDFQKDMIIPVIYSNENYEYIKNNNYHAPPERKVLTAKLNRVQSVVQTIVTKKSIQASKKQPLYQHSLSRPQIKCKRRSLQTITAQKPDTMFMDIDQRLNQKALMYQQQTTYAEQKLKQIRERVIQAKKDKQTKQADEINFYLTELVPKKKSRILPSTQIFISTSMPFDKKIKGYVQQHQQRQQKRQFRNKKQVRTQSQMKVKQIKGRPKTAGEVKHRKKLPYQSQYQHNPVQILFRCNSLMNTRLSRYQQGIEERENIKKSMKNSSQKQRMKKLFNRIQSNCLQNTLTRSNIVNGMNKLAMVWRSQKQFLNAPMSAVMQITDDTLQLLKSRRKKEAQIAKIDQNYIEQAKTEEFQFI